MVESVTVTEEKEKDKLDYRKVALDFLYGTVRGLGWLGLKAFTNLKIEGEENIPMIGKAIITTVTDNILRDMVIIAQLSGRKIHFMVDPKLMKHAVAGPLLKSLGMIRGTTSKEDTEPIDKVFEILNKKKELVAMTPESKRDFDIQVKSMAAIIKFAIAADAPIIPVAISNYRTMLFNIIKTSSGFKMKVGTPLHIEKKLNRDKYRNQRYELAEDIIKIVETLRASSEEEEEEEF